MVLVTSSDFFDVKGSKLSYEEKVGTRLPSVRVCEGVSHEIKSLPVLRGDVPGKEGTEGRRLLRTQHVKRSTLFHFRLRSKGPYSVRKVVRSLEPRPPV